MNEYLRVQNLPLPAQATTPLPADDRAQNRSVVKAVKSLNTTESFGPDRELTFSLDRDTRRVVIRLIDRKSREVIQQIPPEAVVKAVQEFKDESRQHSTG